MPTAIDDDQVRQRVIQRGLLPWSLQEYARVGSFYRELMDTPPDQWDLRNPRLLFEDGRIEEFPMDMLRPLNQVVRFINEMYAASSTAALSYTYRWIAMQNFLVRHRDRLIAEGWLRPTSREDEIRLSLRFALCQMPYARDVRFTEAGELGEGAFPYDDVVTQAAVLDADRPLPQVDGEPTDPEVQGTTP